MGYGRPSPGPTLATIARHRNRVLGAGMISKNHKEKWMSRLSRVQGCGFGCTAVALLVLAFSTIGCHRKTSSANEAGPGQTTYASPDEAGKALAEAARSGNQQQMLEIFGPGAKDMLYSGDAAQDQADMAGFTDAYAQMNRWRKLENGQILIVGATNIAFPVPLLKDRKGQWYFDTPDGAAELAVRRIGRNELATIDVVASLCDAQEEYFNQAHEGMQQYARRFISDEGKENGLYWPPTAGKAKSPVGPLLAYATEQGANLKPSLHKPFHGYYYGVLVTQGPWANGGLRDYIREGAMTRGFGFIAWPAEYGKSGKMTFIVDHDRIIYQKDLGKTTKDQAPFTTQFAQDGGWLRVEQ